MGKSMVRFVFMAFIVTVPLQLFAEGPEEHFYFRTDGSRLWQEAIGIFVVAPGEPVLTVHRTPNGSDSSIYGAGAGTNGFVLPLSAFGYYSEGMKNASCRFPLLAKEGKWCKIVYHINKGEAGWVKLDARRTAKLFSDTLAFLDKDAVCLAAVGAKKPITVSYCDKPNGKVLRRVVVNPQAINLSQDDIGRMGAVWHPYHYRLHLGTVVRTQGDWIFLRDCYHNTHGTKPEGWIRIFDEGGKLLVWLIDIDRC